jgi:hypothetical protein
MTKPQPLIQLLDELRENSISTTVVTIGNSSATITLAGEVDGIVLSPEECELLLDTPDSVQQFHEAIGTPNDATLELHKMSVDDEVMDALNEMFSSVEEA